MKPGSKVSDRRRIGGDVYLAAYPPRSVGPSEELRIDTGFAVADWKACSPASALRAAFPGTAIRIEGRWYEITEVTGSRGAPRRFYYRVAPWDSAEAIRATFDLTPEACAALTAEHREREQRRRRAGILGYLPFLTGLLPGSDQRELERNFGISAIAASWISAGLLLSVSMLGVMIAFAYSRGMAFGGFRELAETIADLSPLAGYLVFESLVRLMSVASHQPMGSLPVVILALVWRGLRGLTSPSPRSPNVSPAAAWVAPGAEHDLLTACDEVRRLPGADGALEILSHLPKDHWTANVTGIEVDGEAYVLVERDLIETDRGPRHRFLLRQSEHDALFSSFVRYRPEEVRDVYLARQRLRTAMWVETVPFFWGLVEPAIQQRLAATYNYDPYKWTRWTIVASAVAGLGLGVRSWGQMLAGGADVGDGAMFFCAVVLLLEAGIRWSKLRGEELRGSLLGLPLKPLATWFLRWE